MWLVLTSYGARPAAVEMRRTFISNLRLLAEVAREPLSQGAKRVASQRGYALRETINANFDKVRSLADAVLFEFSSSRQQDLALRDQSASGSRCCVGFPDANCLVEVPRPAPGF